MKKPIPLLVPDEPTPEQRARVEHFSLTRAIVAELARGPVTAPELARDLAQRKEAVYAALTRLKVARQVMQKGYGEESLFRLPRRRARKAPPLQREAQSIGGFTP